ncbi:MAG: PrsW family intramembrane metalloprotease [Candidatus Niyogibacteria bacterium]|nr:PrsW family intramembrane metalloprotease [Candidatus Niyogibacteria bacterium]
MAQEIILIASSTVSAIFIGFLPAVLWLWFWLKEDPHPEPRRALAATFLAGIIVVPIALFLEKTAYYFLIKWGLADFGVFGFSLFIIWAGIEEYLKYFAAKITAFRRPSFNEPIDAPIYLITAALGFAALENVFFLFKTHLTMPELSLITGEMRFIGATLLHLVTSAIVGMSVAFSFFHPEKRSRNVFGGLMLAILLHALFNLFIIKSGENEILNIFVFVWIGAITLLFFFEKVKKIIK